MRGAHDPAKSGERQDRPGPPGGRTRGRSRCPAPRHFMHARARTHKRQFGPALRSSSEAHAPRGIGVVREPGSMCVDLDSAPSELCDHVLPPAVGRGREGDETDNAAVRGRDPVVAAAGALDGEARPLELPAERLHVLVHAVRIRRRRGTQRDFRGRRARPSTSHAPAPRRDPTVYPGQIQAGRRRSSPRYGCRPLPRCSPGRRG